MGYIRKRDNLLPGLTTRERVVSDADPPYIRYQLKCSRPIKRDPENGAHIDLTTWNVDGVIPGWPPDLRLEIHDGDSSWSLPDIRIGDAELDKQFKITGEPEAEVR